MVRFYNLGQIAIKNIYLEVKTLKEYFRKKKEKKSDIPEWYILFVFYLQIFIFLPKHFNF